jgi:hypothetical protein
MTTTGTEAVMAKTAIEAGTRVVFVDDVERYPHFIIRAGTTGIVIEAQPDAGYSETMYLVKVDEEVPGLSDDEEWQGEFCYIREDYDCDRGVLPFASVDP